mgnify:CR=1 FL=1
MKIAIVFYSFSGNTRKACKFLKGQLSASHEVELLELMLKEPERSFFRQGKAAFLQHTPELVNHCDVSKYDFVVLASPVWAFTFAPALRTFLKVAGGLENKKTAVFVTCGSAFPGGRALEKFKNVVLEKKVQVRFSKCLIGDKTDNQKYLDDAFKDLLSAL